MRCKKIIVIAFISLFVLLQRYMMKTDLQLIHRFQEPRFCLEINSYQDDGKGKYYGLGYSFEVGTFFPELEMPIEVQVPKFTSYVINIGGLEIHDEYIDYDVKEFTGWVYKVEKSDVSDAQYIYLEDVGRKIIVISDLTKFAKESVRGDQEIKVGDTVKVNAVFFQSLMETKKDDWVYSASQVEFINEE